MASLNELIARWLLKRLRTEYRDDTNPAFQALSASLEQERRRVRRLKASAKDREERHDLLKLRHDKLKAKMQQLRDLLETAKSERDAAQTQLRLEVLQRQALEWETCEHLSRPGVVPLAGREERREWLSFARDWRIAWSPTMRLGVLRQHEPRPVMIETFPDRGPPGDPNLWPKVSIVTPSFRQAAYLERTVRSVLQQDYPNIEYRVMDGGSTDGSVDILKRYEPRLASWSSAPDSGAASAINAGFALCDGEIMGWLNSDDMLMPGAVRFVAQYLATHPEVDAVYGHRLIIDERDQQVGRWVLPHHDPEMLLWADYIPQETLFWRRTLWDKAGGQLDETFGFAFDWDLLLRFQQAGGRIVRLPFFLGSFRVHDRQKSISEINSTGSAEVTRIRSRTLGNQFTVDRLERRAVRFQKQALRHDRLLRWGIRTPLSWNRPSRAARPLSVDAYFTARRALVPETLHFCTCFDRHYAAFGISMLRSLLKQCPRSRITVLCLDDSLEVILAEVFDSRVELMRLSVLLARQPVLKSLLQERQPWEGYALIKPFLIETLLDRFAPGSQLAFIDADLYFFADPSPLFAEASGSVAISPHRFNTSSEHLLRYGRFNAGFIIWSNDSAGRACVRNWAQKCMEWCLNSAQADGRFMDQGYLNDWPQQQSGIVQLSHPGHNLAPWNVGSHHLSACENGIKVDGRPLLFFHFSGLVRSETGVWKTYYTFPCLREDLVLHRVFGPYCRDIEAVRAMLLERHGICGTGSVRDLDRTMPMLEVWSPQMHRRLVWLPSFPRSGNRLARLILDGLFKAETFTIYTQLGEPDINPPAREWQGPYPDLLTRGPLLEDCVFLKTHEMPSTDHAAIYIVRDGRDAYVSYAHFVRQHFPGQVEGMTYLDVLKMLVTSTGHYGGWSNHVNVWTSREAPTAVIRYEDMVANPAGAMTKACSTLGIQVPEASGNLPGFAELKSVEPSQFRRGKAGSWRDEMTPEIEDLFWQIHGDTMIRLGYAR